FEASRSQLVRETIKPALERGLCVIADRFLDSTTVYQGAARKLDHEMVERLNAFVVGDCAPDITFVLDVDAATAASRMQKPRKADRMEQQPAEFYERVRVAYRQLAKREPNRVVLIDGSRDANQIENEIWEMLAISHVRCAMFDVPSFGQHRKTRAKHFPDRERNLGNAWLAFSCADQKMEHRTSHIEHVKWLSREKPRLSICAARTSRIDLGTLI